MELSHIRQCLKEKRYILRGNKSARICSVKDDWYTKSQKLSTLSKMVQNLLSVSICLKTYPDDN